MHAITPTQPRLLKNKTITGIDIGNKADDARRLVEILNSGKNVEPDAAIWCSDVARLLNSVFDNPSESRRFLEAGGSPTEGSSTSLTRKELRDVLERMIAHLGELRRRVDTGEFPESHRMPKRTG